MTPPLAPLQRAGVGPPSHPLPRRRAGGAGAAGAGLNANRPGESPGGAGSDRPRNRAKPFGDRLRGPRTEGRGPGAAPAPPRSSPAPEHRTHGRASHPPSSGLPPAEVRIKCMAGYAEEYAAARAMRRRARRWRNYLRMVGAVRAVILFSRATSGPARGFQKTVLSGRLPVRQARPAHHDFEIRDPEKFKHAGFAMYFIPDPRWPLPRGRQEVRGDEVGGRVAAVEVHFQVALAERAGSMDGITASIVTGVTGTCGGDMATALADAYRTWKANPRARLRGPQGRLLRQEPAHLRRGEGGLLPGDPRQGPVPSPARGDAAGLSGRGRR